MELEFIRWLRDHVPRHPNAPLGLSDDAALVSLGKRSNIVVTIDTLTDGVDFRVGVDDPRRIGRQALAANLSDLAAMAATPVAAVVSLALPRNDPTTNNSLTLAIALFEGIVPLAQEYDVAIAGGDTNVFDGPLVISVAALGVPTSRGPLTRSDGKPGDWLLVTGDLGGSILGHLFDFTPRVREAITLHERYALHAAIDISDGLALDASRLAAESGCGATIFMDRVPIAPDAFKLSEQENAGEPATAALHHALGDGQDFELLIAAPPELAKCILHDKPVECRITHVGELTADTGLWQQTASGERMPLEAIGWRHA